MAVGAERAVAMDYYSTLRYDSANGVCRIILDRPPLNLIDETLTREYHDALRRADADSSCRAIVLSGSGKGLSGGLDIKFVESFDQAEMEQFLRLFYVETITICRKLSKPLITMVQGYAREGACTLAFGGDMIIAAEDADFGYPAVPNLAGPPGMHVWFLQRLIGRMKAAELIYTGEPITAVEAAAMGLITKVVPHDSLEGETLKLAEKIASMSPLAIQRTRQLMFDMEDMDFTEVPDVALKALSEAFSSEDSKEARLAFREKRRPKWSNK